MTRIRHAKHDPAVLGVSKYELVEDELFETPEWCTRVLLEHFTFPKVWEPACGNGAISKVLAAAGSDVASSDLRDRGYGSPNIDFLACTDPVARDIVTNPPFSLADAFVRKALELTAPSGDYVAMLLRNEWDAASSRDDLFVPGSRFRAKLILTERPRWIPGTKMRPRHNFAWYVWAGTPQSDAILRRGR